jgi:flagellar hook-associated protein 3 FlgL
MRVTQSMLYHTSTTALNRSAQNLLKVSEQVSTTKRLNRPSDDPADVRSAVKLRDSLAELDQFVRNIDGANRWVSAADTALGSAGELIQRASELALEGANGSLSADDRASIAQEIVQIAGGMLQAASAKAGDEYVFSGYRVDRAPFALTGPAAVGTYQGDAGALTARIGPDSELQLNVTADAVFKPAFDALSALYNDLQSGAAVQQGTIGQIQTALQTVLTARAATGARANRLDQTKASQDALIEDSTKLLSDLEDADMAQAITEYTERQTTYQAALKVNARVLQNSLIDYLS